MSIEAAARELTKEIDRLTKETERLTKFRDSLLSGSVASGLGTTKTPRKAGAKKVAAKKTAAKKAAGPIKRTLSAAGRKAISDAAKRRWAEKKKAAAAK